MRATLAPPVSSRLRSWSPMSAATPQHWGGFSRSAVPRTRSSAPCPRAACGCRAAGSGRARATPSASAKATAKPRIFQEPPAIGPREVSTTVVLTANADQDLREQLAGDGLEESGWLFGVRDRDGITVHTIQFSSESRTTRSVSLVAEVRDRLAAHFKSVGWSSLGDIHTHPDGDPEPSLADRRAWSSSADQAGATWSGCWPRRGTLGRVATGRPPTSPPTSSSQTAA